MIEPTPPRTTNSNRQVQHRKTESFNIWRSWKLLISPHISSLQDLPKSTCQSFQEITKTHATQCLFAFGYRPSLRFPHLGRVKLNLSIVSRSLREKSWRKNIEKYIHRSVFDIQQKRFRIIKTWIGISLCY